MIGRPDGVQASSVTRIQVEAGKTLLEGYMKTPQVGLCELIWNAFDEDAKHLEVEVETGALGGIDLVRVRDDGNGMNRERAALAFSRVGDSWKLPPGTTSADGRPVHGKHGRGRYAAFSIGRVVQWVPTAKAPTGDELHTIRARGSRSSLTSFEIDDLPRAQDETGTTVEIVDITEEAVRDFEETTALRQRLLTEFALHLDRYSDFSITFLGATIDPSAVIESRTEIPTPTPDGVSGKLKLTVIEWTLSGVDRQLYLCNPGGAIVDAMPPGIQAAGAEFTAYLEWDGFRHDQGLLLDGDNESPAGRVVQAAREELRKHLSESARRREVVTVQRWRAEGIYPYKDEPKSAVEKATRDTFNIVALAASRTLDEAKSHSSKALALGLLKETFENNPESLLPILRQFSRLPQGRIDELREVLEHTTLTQLIALGKEIGDRVEFLSGLNELLFERQIKRRLLERRQLHRILAHETWIFGEEWSLTGDDERLTEVLKKFLLRLGADAELAGTKPVLREDASDAIPVLGRRLESRQNHFQHLIVELKRPRHRLNDEDVLQIRSYASAITNDERFDQPNTSWEFWLVGNETTRSVDEARKQRNLPFGVVHNGESYQIIVRTWAEVIGDADHRLKFVQRSLQYESDKDTGLASMRDRYAAYLPEDVVAHVQQASDVPAESAG